jgi:hypothetical protein
MQGENIYPDDGGGKVLRNVAVLPYHYMESKPTTPRLEYLETPRFWRVPG